MFYELLRDHVCINVFWADDHETYVLIAADIASSFSLAGAKIVRCSYDPDNNTFRYLLVCPHTEADYLLLIRPLPWADCDALVKKINEQYSKNKS